MVALFCNIIIYLFLEICLILGKVKRAFSGDVEYGYTGIHFRNLCTFNNKCFKSISQLSGVMSIWIWIQDFPEPLSTPLCCRVAYTRRCCVPAATVPSSTLLRTVVLQGSLHEEMLCTSRDCPIFYPVKNCCVAG